MTQSSNALKFYDNGNFPITQRLLHIWKAILISIGTRANALLQTIPAHEGVAHLLIEFKKKLRYFCRFIFIPRFSYHSNYLGFCNGGQVLVDMWSDMGSLSQASWARGLGKDGRNLNLVGPYRSICSEGKMDLP